MNEYRDIIDRNRPESAKHPRMPRAERAKQFMPFATLRGLGDEMADREILPADPGSADDDRDESQDALLRELRTRLEARERPQVSFDLYEKDMRGRFTVRRVSGRAEHLSPAERLLRVDGTLYPLDDLRFIPEETDPGDSGG